MNITELEIKKARAWDDAKAFLDGKNGVMNAEDRATYDAMLQKVDDLDAAIKLVEDANRRDGELSAVKAEPIVNSVSENKGDKRESAEYKKAFHSFLTKRGFQNTNGDLQEGTGSEGGYLVPKEFERTLIKKRDSVDPIFGLAKRITMGASEKDIPICGDQGTATLIAEEGSYGVDGDTFAQKTLHAYKFGRIIKISDELLADSAFDMETYCAESLGLSIGRAEAKYFWTGTGTSQPEGIMSMTEAITTATSGTIIADEIIDLYYALKGQYRPYAVWVMSNSCAKTIRKLKDSQNRYLWTDGFNAQPDTILGRPVYISDQIDEVAAGKKVCVFGDFSYFAIGDRSGINMKKLNELYSANGQVGFRGDARCDAHPLVTEAFKILKVKA